MRLSVRARHLQITFFERPGSAATRDQPCSKRRLQRWLSTSNASGSTRHSRRRLEDLPWSPHVYARLLGTAVPDGLGPGVADGVVEEPVELVYDSFERRVGALGAGEDDSAFDGGYRDRAERARSLFGYAGALEQLGVELL